MQYINTSMTYLIFVCTVAISNFLVMSVTNLPHGRFAVCWLAVGYVFLFYFMY